MRPSRPGRCSCRRPSAAGVRRRHPSRVERQHARPAPSQSASRFPETSAVADIPATAGPRLRSVRRSRSRGRPDATSPSSANSRSPSRNALDDRARERVIATHAVADRQCRRAGRCHQAARTCHAPLVARSRTWSCAPDVVDRDRSDELLRAMEFKPLRLGARRRGGGVGWTSRHRGCAKESLQIVAGSGFNAALATVR